MSSEHGVSLFVQTLLGRYIYALQPKTWRCDILGFSPVKISWGIFHLRRLMEVRL